MINPTYNCTFMWNLGIILPTQNTAKIACIIYDNLQAAYIVSDQESCTITFNIYNEHVKYTISYQGDNIAIYNAIATVITIFLNKNNIQSMEGININPKICSFINNGLSTRGFHHNNNIYSLPPKPTIKDIRNMFPLWDHHDECIINLYHSNTIKFYHHEDPKHRFLFTNSFCKALNMNNEETLFWNLKYGPTLPKYLNHL